eukprot:CAMPEP_0173393750 /NCGR_PEP_ID=MMETSP1356-20130122/22284_1 /TAXON_ID=77927 ORGANISM="Hemiselmis virescens, Strain PCC157" /NCGR_SAMPLE_ID=MMETSP1356 /ASSEMBLY_ACC=CAM_ASM_000847 /LENGTH=538 /DNA_ID=CAMNT_0014351817 /DNA_START=47 /DNA_END=1663 /DNA_ORIENTATION=-
MVKITFLDYGAGNIRSLRNALTKVGCDIQDVKSADDIANARILVFPGVGSFGACVENLDRLGYTDALRAYVQAGRCFFGICLGMQCLFESSEETPGVKGLGVIPGKVTQFNDPTISVPHMGWNALRKQTDSEVLAPFTSMQDRFYFVHSFRVLPIEANKDWVLSLTDYGNTDAAFVSSVQKGSVCGCQFHPEKSGANGLNLLSAFLTMAQKESVPITVSVPCEGATVLAKRIIACLDVRENDSGDLVVTKGDQYDVREKGSGEAEGDVRNLGKPVDLARRYSEEGADEITFLNITSFRGDVVDAPMLRVLELTSEHVFVPLCIGGGIRDYTDSKGVLHSALDVASAYFRSGADKVSIGSDAVYAAEKYYAAGNKGDGKSCIEAISRVYGRQAVVISVDPKRVYVASKDESKHTVLEVDGGKLCWWQCTVMGGRETRDMDAFELAQACEALGAGEILLNCIDMDGQNSGFDKALIKQMKASVTIPVIASSGAGKPQHFIDIFKAANPDAGLAAGIFHRKEVGINEVKKEVIGAGIPCRA